VVTGVGLHLSGCCETDSAGDGRPVRTLRERGCRRGRRGGRVVRYRARREHNLSRASSTPRAPMTPVFRCRQPLQSTHGSRRSVRTPTADAPTVLLHHRPTRHAQQAGRHEFTRNISSLASTLKVAHKVASRPRRFTSAAAATQHRSPLHPALRKARPQSPALVWRLPVRQLVPLTPLVLLLRHLYLRMPVSTSDAHPLHRKHATILRVRQQLPQRPPAHSKSRDPP
jgi:hypothetical protein